MSLPALVDSHCHLDFPDFAGETDAVVAARRGGRRHPHGHHLHPAARGTPRARHRRGAWWRVLRRRHPSDERRLRTARPCRGTGGAQRASEDGRHRRDRARLSLYRRNRRRSARQPRRPYRGRAPNRPAADHPRARRRRRYRSHPRGGTRGRAVRLRHALFHRLGGAGGNRARTWASTSLSRASRRSRPPATCARSSPPPRATGCWWKPTARISRHSRIAASATSPPSPPTPRAPWQPASTWTCPTSPRSPRPISTGCSPRRPPGDRA